MSDIKFPAYVSLEAKDLIKALLQKNPNDRIDLKSILDHAFILKFQTSNSVNGPSKRCMSYDSGLATASYMTPTNINTREFLCATEGNFASHIGSDGCSRSGHLSGHLCPNQEMYSHQSHPLPVNHQLGGGVEFCEGSHAPLMPNRFLPTQTSYSSRSAPIQPAQHCQLQHSGICPGNNCSNAWRQTKQTCSHSEICECQTTAKTSCCSTTPKYEDNRRSRTEDVACAPPPSEKSGSSKVEKKRSGLCGNTLDANANKIPVAPVSAIRLRPVRQKAKNVVCSILKTSDVCLEFTRQINGQERVWEVMQISSDGMRVH